MKTHKNNFPDFQQTKTFFQSFFQKPIFILKKIISLQLMNKSSVFAIMILVLEDVRSFKNLQELSVKNARYYASSLICKFGNSHNLKDG